MGTLTSAGGTTLTSPLVITSGANANATSAKTVTANQQFLVKAGGGIKTAAISGASIDVSGASTFDSTVIMQGNLSAQGGLDVSGATKVGILSADSITASGACNFEDEVTFRDPVAISTALGNFAVVTALTSTNQSAPAWAEISAVDTWLAISVCGRNLAIPLVSSTIQ